MMDVQKFKEKSVWAKEARDEGFKLGLDEGKKLGLDEGKKLGLDEGKTAGQRVEGRNALRRVLARRGLSLSPEQQARIDACDDLEQLERWLDQAVTASSADEALS